MQMPTMFFQGDLQSGIALALQEQKLVACFVHDDGATSQEWEQSWLADAEIRSLLEAKVVLLRLEDGSQEAGFLSAFCPIPSVPSLLMISNGQLTAKMTADLSRAEFMSSLKGSLEGAPGKSTGVSSSQSYGSSESSDSLRAETERTRSAVAAGKVPMSPNEPRSPETRSPAAQRQQVNQAKKVKQEAKDERQRILQKIENDKQERKSKEQHRRTQSKGENDSSKLNGTTSPREDRHPSGSLRECAIQVRLFDGSTIRQRFSSWKTIRTHVRPWIEKQRNGDDTPYTFRQILAPKPNRQIEISEEDEDLDALGLYPSATLVMVPVHGFTNAYSPQGSSVTQGVSSGYNIVSSGVGMLGNAIGSFFGYGAAPPPNTSAPTSQPGSSSQPVRSIERDDGEGHHLYTGNGINVEPRGVDMKREDSWG